MPRPIAFITPISLNSDEIVNEIVNLRTISATITSIALTAKSSRATIISKMYDDLMNSLFPQNAKLRSDLLSVSMMSSAWSVLIK